MSNRPDNIISLPGAQSRRKLQDERLREIVTSCESVLEAYFHETLADLFENIDDALYDFADRSEDSAVQAEFFDSMRDVRRERKRMEGVFKRKFLNAFDGFWSDRHIQGEDLYGVPAASLSLVGDDELEESLAITNIVSKIEHRFSGSLADIAQRFSHLAGSVDVHSNNNPLGPAAICRVFQEVLSPVDINVRVKLVVYKLFEKYVMLGLGDLYRDINQRLIEQGVLPDLKPRSNHRRGPSLERLRDGVAAARPGRRSQRPERPTDPEIFERLEHLLERSRPHPASTPSGPSAGEGVPAWGIHEVVQALDLLQQQDTVFAAYTAGKDLNSSRFKMELIGKINEQQGNRQRRSIGHVEADTIDIVGMIFQFILDDRNLPDAMKAMLSRLQIPILKVAILDKQLFTNNSHPARCLLNRLAQAGMSWNDEQDRSPGSLYAKMDSIITRVLAELTDDVGLFDELLADFEAFFADEQHHSEIIEGRTNQVNQGREQLQIAKRKVGEVVAARLKGHECPHVVEILLHEAWKNVLLLVHLREGVNSHAWVSNLEVMDRLLWSVEPKPSAEDKKALLDALPDLLGRIRDGVATVSYDHRRRRREGFPGRWFR
jgi:hypothetical protein